MSTFFHLSQTCKFPVEPEPESVQCLRFFLHENVTNATLKAKMKHAAVNTDPIPALDCTGSRGCLLKARNVQHRKIGENEVQQFYDVGSVIGQGNFGVVQAVKEKNDTQLWAMKTVVKTSTGERLKLINREIQILKLIDHPHIIYLRKVLESPKRIYMIFEHCKGELAAIYKERKPFNETVTRKVIGELTEAVAYLHKFEIVHRDIKLENILIGENPADPQDEYYVKLTDFGLSIVKSGSGVQSAALTEHCGTLAYMSPEMISNCSYTQQCDVWAIGVIIYLLLMGDFPFNADTQKELKFTICNDDVHLDKVDLSVGVVDLIKQTLMKNPANRITAAEILEHPWIRNKKLMVGAQRSTNILDMMKSWKEEMMVALPGEESDWYDATYVNGKKDSAPKVSEKLPSRNNSYQNKKQALVLPKTDISFKRTPPTTKVDSDQSNNSNEKPHHHHHHHKPTPTYTREKPSGKESASANSSRPASPRAPATEIIFPTKLESGRIQTLREAAKPAAAKEKDRDGTTGKRKMN